MEEHSVKENKMKEHETKETVVGIIGMGDMGKMYARQISDAGWR